MLKTWITGTNDFVDQGLLPSEWINDNVTISNDGKLGKCLYFNGTSSRLSTTNYTLGNKWSWACWVKEDPSITAWQLVIMLNSSGSDSDSQTALWLKANEHRFEVCNNTKYNSTIQYTQGQWNHYAMSFDGTTTKAYLNGSQVATFTSTSILSRTNLTIGARGSSTNGGHTSATNFLKGYINDLRIWDDEVISPLQVKQISQGLILHYPLDNNGVGGENIFKKTREVFDNNGSRLSSTTVNNGLIIDSTAPNGKYRSWNIVAENGANRGVYYTYTNSNISLDDLIANEIYTLSFWSRCSKTKNLIIGSLAESQTVQKVDGGDIPSSGNIIVDNKWKRHSVTFKWISTSKITTCFYLYLLDENVTLDIASPKLEKGDKATPWCPNSSDALATAIGLNDNIEYDTSGFGNNGTRTGTFSWTSDTPKYSVSTEFNTDTSKYIRDVYAIKGLTMNEVSVSLWFNTSSSSESVSGDGENFFSFAYNSGLRARIPKNSTNTIWLCDGMSYTFTSNTSFVDGKWHLLVITFNSGVYKCFIDGTQIGANGTKSTSTITFADNEYYRIATSQNGAEHFVGSLSDFRIYATALSAEDIQKLYSVSALIDSHGNTFASSYVEG